MDNNFEKVKEKVRRYLEEKEGLDLQNCYFLTKGLNEEYWEEIQNEGEEEEEVDEIDDDFGDDERRERSKASESDGDVLSDDDVIPDKIPPLNIKERKAEPVIPLVNKPRIRIKGR